MGTHTDALHGSAELYQRLNGHIFRECFAQVSRLARECLVRVAFGILLRRCRQPPGDHVQQRNSGVAGQRQERDTPQDAIRVGCEIEWYQ